MCVYKCQPELDLIFRSSQRCVWCPNFRPLFQDYDPLPSSESTEKVGKCTALDFKLFIEYSNAPYGCKQMKYPIYFVAYSTILNV